MDSIYHTPADSNQVRAMTFATEPNCLLTATKDALKLWSWEQSPKLQQSFDVAWDKISEIRVSKTNQMVGGSFNCNFVSVWSLNLDDVRSSKAPIAKERNGVESKILKPTSKPVHHHQEGGVVSSRTDPQHSQEPWSASSMRDARSVQSSMSPRPISPVKPTRTTNSSSELNSTLSSEQRSPSSPISSSQGQGSHSPISATTNGESRAESKAIVTAREINRMLFSTKLVGKAVSEPTVRWECEIGSQDVDTSIGESFRKHNKDDQNLDFFKHSEVVSLDPVVEPIKDTNRIRHLPPSGSKFLAGNLGEEAASIPSSTVYSPSHMAHMNGVQVRGFLPLGASKRLTTQLHAQAEPCNPSLHDPLMDGSRDDFFVQENSFCVHREDDNIADTDMLSALVPTSPRQVRRDRKAVMALAPSAGKYSDPVEIKRASRRPLTRPLTSTSIAPVYTLDRCNVDLAGGNSSSARRDGFDLEEQGVQHNRGKSRSSSAGSTREASAIAVMSRRSEQEQEQDKSNVDSGDGIGTSEADVAVGRALSTSVSFTTVLSHRLTMFRQLARMWNKREYSAVVEKVATMQAGSVLDPSQQTVIADFLCSIDLRGAGITLEDCGKFLKLLENMMTESGKWKSEHAVVAILKSLVSLLESFGELIKQTRSIIVVGVNITREERLDKCNLCHAILRRVRNRMDQIRHHHRHSHRVLDLATTLQPLIDSATA